MAPLQEYFHSVEDVWAIVIVCAVLLGCGVYWGLSRCSWRSWKQFSDDEDGASYAIPYVMTFPIYLLIVCLILQGAMILMVKMGSIYAAYTAARSAVVWQSAGTAAEARSKARRAAVAAMTPFASSDKRHQKAFLVTPFPTPDAIIYYDAYARAAKENRQQDPGKVNPAIRNPSRIASANYITTKYNFASRAVSLDLTPAGAWNSDVEATLRYEMPMSVPGAGRILGRPWLPQRFYSRLIESRVTLPSETPRTPDGQIGIGYDPRQL